MSKQKIDHMQYDIASSIINRDNNSLHYFDNSTLDDNMLRERFSIYVYTAYQSWINAIISIYPKTLACLHTEQAHTIVRYYVEASPPDHVNLNSYGEGFANYLYQQSTQLKLPPFLYDACSLEWKHYKNSTYSNEVSIQKDWHQLNIFPSEKVVFALLPGLALHHSHWKISALWQAEENPRSSIEGSDEHLVIFDQDIHTKVEPVNKTVFSILLDIQQGKHLAYMINKHDKIVEETLVLLLSKGWIVGYFCDEE